jgi:hypothetical protein
MRIDVPLQLLPSTQVVPSRARYKRVCRKKSTKNVSVEQTNVKRERPRNDALQEPPLKQRHNKEGLAEQRPVAPWSGLTPFLRLLVHT